MISSIPKEIVDYESEIIDYIRGKPDGVTITDIAKYKKHSRNTVSKYVSLLILKKKIFSRKVGAYKLYFCEEEISFPKIFIIEYYKGILSGLKQKFPDSEDLFKEIGRICYKHIDLSLGDVVSKELKGPKVNRFIKIYNDVFGKFYPSSEVTNPLINISLKKLDNNKTKTILKFTHSEFLQDTDDFIYHAYIVSGLIEELWKKEVGRIIQCNVESVHISDKIEDSYYELSIEVE